VSRSLLPGDPGEGRVLALDPGAVRVGVALSDPTRTLASPRTWLPFEGYQAVAARVRALVEAEQVTLVVVGLPLAPDGGPSTGETRARRLARRIRADAGVPVAMVDEACTSVGADERLAEARPRARGGRDKGARDAVAAALLLEGVLRGEAPLLPLDPPPRAAP